jgi:hypothetical protein
MSKTRLRWLWGTPLGAPVEPDVYMSWHSVSGGMATRGALAGAVVSRSSRFSTAGSGADRRSAGAWRVSVTMAPIWASSST